MNNYKKQTYQRTIFLLDSIETYKIINHKYPDDLAYLQDINSDNYSWCSAKSSQKIVGEGLCYYSLKNGIFTLEVIGDYNDWYYNSKDKILKENHFDRWGL